MSSSNNQTPIPMEQFVAPAQRALIGAGYTTLEQLAAAREEDIKALHGIGKKALQTLNELLAAQGLSFANGDNA